MGFGLIQTVAPAVEPVTLDEMKLHCGSTSPMTTT
jgi:hypothetical protein